MRVFVTGGTGAIGDHAVPALIASGHSVTALARTSERASRLAAQGARPVIVSLFDRDALAREFEGHDAIANLASALPSTGQFMSRRAWRRNDEVRIDGSNAVVDAAIAAGVERLIQESVAMIYADSGSDWIDESAPVDHFPIARGNHAAEANAARFTEAGHVGVVLRLGWFYGPGATHSEEFLDLAHRHVCIRMGRPDTYVSSIHMHDAGAAVAAALAASEGTYNVVDDEPLTKREYASALAAAAGRRAWLHLPGRAALLLGDRTTSLTRSLRVSNRRFKQEVEWLPRYLSARDGWPAFALAQSEPVDVLHADDR